MEDYFGGGNRNLSPIKRIACLILAIAGILTLFVLAYSMISFMWVFFVLGLLLAIPLLFPLGMGYFIAVSFFTPNPRKHGILLGWLFAEFIEHVTVPLIIVLTIVFSPFAGLYPFVLFFVVMLIYGRVLGSTKKATDWLKITGLWLSVMLLLWLPVFVWTVDIYTGIPSFYCWVVFMLSLVGVYVYHNRKQLFEVKQSMTMGFMALSTMFYVLIFAV